MAGVIASVSLHSKEVKNQRGSPLSTCKSNYIIRQFDKTFNPSKHNIFLVRRADLLERARQKKNKSAVMLDFCREQEEKNKPVTVSRMICEVLLLSM